MNRNLGARHKVNTTRDPNVIREKTPAKHGCRCLFTSRAAGDHYDRIARADDSYLITRNSIYRRNTMRSAGTTTPHTWY